MTRFLSRTGLALAVLALILAALGRTALPAVVDIPMIAFATSVAALLLLGAAFVLGWRPAGAIRFAAAALLALGAFWVLAWATGQRFLSWGAEEVRFASGGVELVGTLYLPRGGGPYPAVVIVHGSGPETRRGYEFYARHFARHGIAALAYDKRGTGASGGKLYESDYADYAGDAAAAVRALAARADVRDSCVGIFGISEAEWVAPLAAARAPVAFLIVVGASGVSPAEQVNAEIAIRLRAAGHPPEAVGSALALNERVFAYQRTGEGADSLRTLLAAARRSSWFHAAEDIPEEVYPAEMYEWWRSVMDFDAAAAWSAVDVPVLLLKGGKDDRSPAGPAFAAIESALRRDGTANVTSRVFPDADHVILEWPLGDRVPPPLFAPQYLDTLVGWTRARVCAGDWTALAGFRRGLVLENEWRRWAVPKLTRHSHAHDVSADRMRLLRSPSRGSRRGELPLQYGAALQPPRQYSPLQSRGRATEFEGGVQMRRDVRGYCRRFSESCRLRTRTAA